MLVLFASAKSRVELKLCGFVFVGTDVTRVSVKDEARLTIEEPRAAVIDVFRALLLRLRVDTESTSVLCGTADFATALPVFCPSSPCCFELPPFAAIFERCDVTRGLFLLPEGVLAAEVWVGGFELKL